MKRMITPIAVILGLSLPAFAMTELDVNADGLLTVDEVQAAYPDVTAEGFSAMDTNADGALDADEVTAAQDSGLMPKTDG